MGICLILRPSFFQHFPSKLGETPQFWWEDVPYLLLRNLKEPGLHSSWHQGIQFIAHDQGFSNHFFSFWVTERQRCVQHSSQGWMAITVFCGHISIFWPYCCSRGLLFMVLCGFKTCGVTSVLIYFPNLISQKSRDASEDKGPFLYPHPNSLVPLFHNKPLFSWKTWLDWHWNAATQKEFMLEMGKLCFWLWFSQRLKSLLA